MREQLSPGVPIEWERWQRLQDHLASVLGVPLRFVDADRNHITQPSWPDSFPVEEALEALRIGEEVETLLPEGVSVDQTTSLTTALDVSYSIVPILSPNFKAYFIVGPVVLGPRSDQESFIERTNAMGLNAPRLWSLLLLLKNFSYSHIHSILNLIQEVGGMLVESSTRKPPLPQKLSDEALQTLLDAAAMATQADGGSIMVYDALKDLLAIRVARGLSRDIIDKSRNRPGEGIAGYAFRQRKICLVDAQTADEGITRFMQRPALVSSLVAPLRHSESDEPFGVLSLRTQRAECRFTAEHVEMLERLLHLSKMAFSGGRLGAKVSPAQGVA